MPDHLSAFQVLKSATFREVVHNPIWHWRELRAAVRHEMIEQQILRRAAESEPEGDPRFDPGAD